MEADGIISKAEGSNVAGLYGELRSYLEPLNGLLWLEGRMSKRKSIFNMRGVAQRYLPFLWRLLKVSCNKLTQQISTSEADELFRSLKFSLDCLDALRPCLEGNAYEIEVHRHCMAKCLIAWKRFTEAREECWVTLQSLEVNIFCEDEKGNKAVLAVKEKQNENDGVNLHGELAEAADSELVELVLGLVPDLIICIGEIKLREADEYHKILVLIDQLVPWQS